MRALTPAAGAEPVDDLAARHPAPRPRRRRRGTGLTAAALAAADTRVRIPMAPGVDSLNVATAAAVALYAVTRRSG